MVTTANTRYATGAWMAVIALVVPMLVFSPPTRGPGDRDSVRGLRRKP